MPERYLGRTLGRFRIESIIGSGGFAWVYKGYDPELEIPVAIKVLKPQYAGEDTFEALPLTPDSFAPGQVVLDMVYTDEPSALLAAAEAAGAATVDGLEMLVQQGALSLRIWTGEEPSIEAMRSAVRQ